ncbi:MAG TPA: type II toxin-antitoxin system prevent-host-death family antitoxin [Tetrasphaera sp.]|uniref:type II toxin-antitoxin system Phd/YefM family antitoxin n=1 Tax=Nostocoides sp. TaxID=1917966 RepID=UPI002CF76F1B|nr:type II toxin-antitoxin system prevent-host-death family antitoxin [Tetrasphaera sp.]HNQ06893.1 type II toxin-antitoxin system prevent-host-death family antitoxin [Tetrasphaera sp.]
METYTVQAAKTQLSRILHDVEAGAEVTISRADRPVARLVPVEPVAKRRFGMMNFLVPADFDAPLSEEELSAWE